MRESSPSQIQKLELEIDHAARVYSTVKTTTRTVERPMSTSVTPAYYMMMIGSSLTLITSIIMIIPYSINSYYSRLFPIYAGLGLGTSFFLTLLPGLACVFLSQLYYTRPPTRLVAGLLVTGLSIVSLIGVIGSGVTIYEGVLFSGPPISFTGGIIGAFLSKTTA